MQVIVYVANSAQIGGGNRVLMDLLTGLDARRFAPLLVSPGPGPLAEWATSRSIEVAVIPRSTGRWAGGRLELMGQAARLALLLARKRARLVHAGAQTCYRPVALAGRLARVARVCHLGFPPGEGELAWVFRLGVEAVAACYEGQAREVAEVVRRVSPRARIVGIRNGVDTDSFAPADPAAPSSPLRFGARHVFVIVGHLSDVKGYPAFVEAAAQVAAEVPDAGFLAVGGETIAHGYRRQLERRVEERGLSSRFHFLGWREDVAEVLRAADVMVLPSLAEGLPIAILEAMACARPVIATPVNGVPEAVTDGVTGLLVPPGDSASLARAMLRLARDPALARRMGAEGRKRAAERFSKGRFVKEVEALYDELLAG